MKKLILLISAFVIFSSCESSYETEFAVYKNKNHYTITSDGGWDINLKIVEIESCEYFIGDYERSLIFEHKGNCKNKIHIQ